MTKKYYTTKELATLLKISKRQVERQLQAGYYPTAIQCECGQKSSLIPINDVDIQDKLKAIKNNR